jgi:hypothetical protein
MAHSDSDSVGSAAHVSKARKGADGHVASLREQFEPSTSQALAIVPTRRSARVQAASQPQTTGKRTRTPAEAADSPAPTSSPAADSPTLTLATLLARVEALEADTQHLRTDLQQTQTELAAARSELAESKVTLDTRLQDHTSHCVARETAVKDELQQLVSTESSSLEHLSRRVRANNIVMHGLPDTAATSRPVDLTRLVKGKLDAAAPRRGSAPAPSQSIQAVSHIGRPGSNKRAVLVEFSTHTAKHEAFKLSPQLWREGLHLADELTSKQLKAQKGLATDFSALRLKGFSPFYRRGQLLYRDQGVNRTCKRGEAIRVSAPSSPPRAIPGPPRPSPAPRAPAAARQGLNRQAPGHPRPGPTDGHMPHIGRGRSYAGATSASAVNAAAQAADAAAAAALAGNGDAAMVGVGDTSESGLPPPPQGLAPLAPLP